MIDSSEFEKVANYLGQHIMSLRYKIDSVIKMLNPAMLPEDINTKYDPDLTTDKEEKMLNNLMKMFNGEMQNGINKIMNEIKHSGMSPEQYAINMLKNYNGNIPTTKMEEFKKFAKQFRSTDEQIKTILDNFEKK